MIGFSMMVVIVTGGLNLAVGAIGVCAAMSCGWLIEARGPAAGRWPSSAGAGPRRGPRLRQRLRRGATGLHSFIITLASMSIFFGVMIFLTRAAVLPGFAADLLRLRPQPRCSALSRRS